MEKRRPVSAKNRLDLRYRRGDATRVFKHAADEINLGDRILTASRVSHWEQKRRGNDFDQTDSLTKHAESFGGDVVGNFAITASGYDPYWMVRLVQLARQLEAKILFESVDRAIRHPGYCKEDQNPQARDCDLDEVASFAVGQTLVTVLHPTATPSEVRSYQTKRGQAMKGKRGGRPNGKSAGYKKRKRQKLQPAAVKLAQSGLSIRAIAAKISVAYPTVQYWLKMDD